MSNDMRFKWFYAGTPPRVSRFGIEVMKSMKRSSRGIWHEVDLDEFTKKVNSGEIKLYGNTSKTLIFRRE